jgi:hypothetical protein
MKIKTTLRFHLPPVKIAIIKNTNNRGQGKGEEMTQTLYAHMNKRS